MIEHFYRRRDVQPEVALFRTKGFAADWTMDSQDGRRRAMRELPPILRSLLVSDGTVSKCLEAFFWEPIRVADVMQGMQPAEQDIGWLDVPAGAQVLVRSVRLVGGHSRTHYASAISVARIDTIPSPFREALLEGRIGIGELIRDCEIETYRELQEIACVAGLPNGDDPAAADGCIYRTYRIVMGGLPALLVSEFFPVAAYSGR